MGPTQCEYERKEKKRVRWEVESKKQDEEAKSNRSKRRVLNSECSAAWRGNASSSKSRVRIGTKGSAEARAKGGVWYGVLRRSD